jgi:hypothetical protein
MDTGLFPDVLNIFKIVWSIFIHGGWVLFVILTVYIVYKVYMEDINDQFLSGLKYTVLEIKPPKENISSFYNAEQIFIQLHTFFDNYTFQETYVEGRLVFRFSLEIISLGGKISYILRVPTKHRAMVEAAFYANYPTLEMNEIHDYLENFHYSPEDPNYDLFGAEFLLTKPQCYPIRTWREFESLKGPEVSELVVDPLTPLFETMTKLSEEEFYGIQYIIQPVADGSWKEEAEAEVNKILGEKEVTGPDGKKSKSKGSILELDDIKKQQITSIKNKLGRPGFATKIRLIHLGTKQHFNKDGKKLVLSPFKIFGSANFNGFRAGFGPKKDWRISPRLEAEYIKWWVNRRKQTLFDGFKARSNYVGEPTYILNTEELATIFHFPVTKTSVVQPVESLESKKVQPPSNLPIEEIME